MKYIKCTVCILLCAVLIISLVGCKNDEKSAEVTPTSAEENFVYVEKWAVNPTIQADRIFTLPLASFNKNTNHYDISFGNYFIIEKGGKFGFIDSNGEIVVEPKYDTIETCPCYNGYYVTLNDEYGYPTTYRFTQSLSRSWAESHSCGGFSGYSYLWNTDSNVPEALKVEEGEDTSIELKAYLPETAQVVKGGVRQNRYALVSGSKAVGGTDFELAGVFSYGISAMKKNGKWGYINSQGKTVVPFEYDAPQGYNALNKGYDTALECSENYITVLKDGKYGILTSEGKMVVPCQYSFLSTVHDGRAFAKTNDGKWGVLLIDQAFSEGVQPPTSAPIEETQSSKPTEAPTEESTSSNTEESSESSSEDSQDE